MMTIPETWIKHIQNWQDSGLILKTPQKFKIVYNTPEAMR